jgi:hypothetical protein
MYLAHFGFYKRWDFLEVYTLVTGFMCIEVFHKSDNQPPQTSFCDYSG